MSARQELSAHYAAVRERMRISRVPVPIVTIQPPPPNLPNNQTPQELIQFRPVGRMSLVNRVVEAVSGATGVAVERIKGRQKAKEVVNARHISFWLLRNDIGLTLPWIAHFFDVDHTSVLYGVKRIERLRIEYEDIRIAIGEAREFTFGGHHYWGA